MISIKAGTKVLTSLLSCQVIFFITALHAQDMPPPSSVAKEISDGKSASENTPSKAVKQKSKSKRGAKLKAKGSIETDNAAENMSVPPESGNMSPSLTPSGGAGFNFKF